MPSPLFETRPAELEHARLGVIFFLGNLEVSFSPEQSVSELKEKALSAVKGVVGDGRILSAATKVGNVVNSVTDSISAEVDDIALTVRKWICKHFAFEESDVRLATDYLIQALPTLIYTIQGEVRKTASDFTPKDMAKGLYTAVTKTCERVGLEYYGHGVVMESGHPDLIADSIKWSVTKSALSGLAEAALAAAKAALVGLSAGVGLIINKIAGVIEALIRFAVRFCDALSLKKVFAEANGRWVNREVEGLVQREDKFSVWFKKQIDRAPVVAALVMNCGVAGDALTFLQVCTSSGVVMHQGQFDKGVTYLNHLKMSASDLILDVQDAMKLSSKDKLVGPLLANATNKGLVLKEAGSSWRSRLYVWTHQSGKASRAINWLLDKAGYKQSALRMG